MNAIVTMQHVVPAGRTPGDYLKLHSNGGSGDVDWNDPVDEAIYPMFPNGAGIYGFGHAPFGHHRFGHGHSMRTPGFGHMPFGRHPFGHGSAIITAKTVVTDCGDHSFAFAAYDEAGNLHTGTPDQVNVPIHLQPDPPRRLKKNSYDKDTDILILDVQTGRGWPWIIF